MVDVLVGKMQVKQCLSQPCFYSRQAEGLEGTVDLELRQDDIYATGPDASLEAFAQEPPPRPR